MAAAAERGFSASSGEPSSELVEAVMRAVQERPLPEPSEQRVSLSAHRPHIERWLQHDGLKLSKVHVRLKQQHFSCSLADIVRHFKLRHTDWSEFPKKVAVQLNDTHPAVEVSRCVWPTWRRSARTASTAWPPLGPAGHSRRQFRRLKVM